MLTLLISVNTTNERLNIAPSKLKVISKIEKLNTLSDIFDFELVNSAEDNYILISKSDDLVGKINFVNKFGDKTDFQINVKKILEVSND